jgi:hypothetical protein
MLKGSPSEKALVEDSFETVFQFQAVRVCGGLASVLRPTLNNLEKQMNRRSIMPPSYGWLAALLGALSMMTLAGCGSGPKGGASSATHGTTVSGHQEAAGAPGQADKDADLRAERAKLSPEDQRLVAAQEFCAVSTEKRLGSMGPPVKLVIKAQPVFLCCKNCQRQALANPDRTLAKVEELKAKVKAAAPK